MYSEVFFKFGKRSVKVPNAGYEMIPQKWSPKTERSFISGAFVSVHWRSDFIWMDRGSAMLLGSEHFLEMRNSWTDLEELVDYGDGVEIYMFRNRKNPGVFRNLIFWGIPIPRIVPNCGPQYTLKGVNLWLTAIPPNWGAIAEHNYKVSFN